MLLHCELSAWRICERFLVVDAGSDGDTECVALYSCAHSRFVDVSGYSSEVKQPSDPPESTKFQIEIVHEGHRPGDNIVGYQVSFKKTQDPASCLLTVKHAATFDIAFHPPAPARIPAPAPVPGEKILECADAVRAHSQKNVEEFDRDVSGAHAWIELCKQVSIDTIQRPVSEGRNFNTSSSPSSCHYSSRSVFYYHHFYSFTYYYFYDL